MRQRDEYELTVKDWSRPEPCKAVSRDYAAYVLEMYGDMTRGEANRQVARILVFGQGLCIRGYSIGRQIIPRY